MKARCLELSLAVVSVLILAALWGVPLCWGQISGTATINGMITDSSGAVVPEAAIEVINVDTKVHTTTKSNSDGTFAIPGLPVGTYDITVSKQGFQTYTETGLLLHPTVVATVNPILKVGALTQQVTVSATGVQVQTTTSEISNEVSAQQAATLPINGRNFQSLEILMPGITNTSPGVAFGGGSDQVNNTISINGMGVGSTVYYIDGIWNIVGSAFYNISITPPPEAIQEVRVLQNNYDLQDNLAGSNVVLVQTKSGSSSFHGSAFEFLRNDALDARNFFSPVVSPLKQNIFGYTFGGPIYIPHLYNTNKQKTFFYWTQQWRYQNIASVVQGASPTAEMRNGTFDHPITNPQTGELFPETSPGLYQITPSLINQSSVALMNALMDPPNNPAGGFLNYINLQPQINRQRDDQIRVDHNFSEKLRLMAEFFDEHQRLNFPNESWLGSPFTSNSFTDGTDSNVAQIALTQTLSPSMVNTTRVATSGYIDFFKLHGIWSRNQIPNFNETLPFNGFLSDRLPEIDFAGGWPSIGVTAPFPLLHASDLEDTLSDDWNWLRRRHSLSAGLNVLLHSKKQNNYSATNGTWFFSGNFTGDPIADFLLGDASSLFQASNESRPYIHDKLISPYFQDRWKATRRLTLSAGVRFMFRPLPNPQPGYVSIFDPGRFDPVQAPIVSSDGTITPTPSYNAANGMIVNSVNGIPQNFSTKHQNYWAPSVGFAWDVFGDGKTSLRGGYGITYAYGPTSADCSYTCSNNPPLATSITLINPNFPDSLNGQVAPQAAPSLQSQDLNLKAPSIQTYSLSLQHEFRGNWLASIAAAGDIARNNTAMWNINQPLPDPPYNYNPIINSGSVFPYLYSPYPGYGSIQSYESATNVFWDALEINVRHPTGHGLFFDASYTWQHNLSESRGAWLFKSGGGPQDIYHPMNDYGNANMNVPQVLAVSVIWTLPWAKNARGAKGLALGGWKYSDITSIQSGFSRDPGLSVAYQGLATRPDRVANVPLGGPRTVQEWFNTNAFQQPAAGYFGNAGPGTIRGPGFVNFDMELSKEFHITEHQTVEFRGELFNIFNHTNFSAVDTTYGSGTYGQLLGAADPRIVEFGLRYVF